MEDLEIPGPELFSFHLLLCPSSPGLLHRDLRGTGLRGTQQPLVPTYQPHNLGKCCRAASHLPHTGVKVTVIHSGSHSPCPKMPHLLHLISCVWPWAITSALCPSFPTCKMDLIMGYGEADMSQYL